MNKIEIPLLSFGLWRHQEKWYLFFSSTEKKGIPQDFDQILVLGWGKKRSGIRAEKIAKSCTNKGFILIEDGFLRSMDLGVNGEDPLSLVVDDLGVYYDATKPSRLEAMILDQDALQHSLSDGEKALALVVENRLTKYNHILEGIPQSLQIDTSKPQVLVIDQTFGDMSLLYGGATSATFTEMLNAAIAENPLAEIWIKVHPDVLAGKKQGHFAEFLTMKNEAPEKYQHIHFLVEDIHPHSLIEKMDRVYVATSQMGFEALLLGKEVITFGLPWYAGWGLTEDRNAGITKLQAEGRREPRTLLELFTASYVQYCRYINPFTSERGSIFDVIEYLIMMKRREMLLQGEIWIAGLSWWKRRIMSPFLKTTGNQLRFFKNPKALQQAYIEIHQNQGNDHTHKDSNDHIDRNTNNNIRLLLWGKKFPELETWANRENLSVLRMEDGFIRSVGLGSNLVAPRSLVIDDLGIYFDASKVSRLEHILENTHFTEDLLKRAEALQAQLVAEKVGKYNVGSYEITDIFPKDQKIFLVPGQVEDDASIQTGTRDISTNLGLLKEVRRQNPKAYIIYKPHPDVVSGNRIGEIAENEALKYADIIMPETDIMALIEKCDELHTMTSLAGFEALLRGKKVHCYGIPFYAGWGLTEDRHRLENRRLRKLILSELIAGTLLLYPEYLNISTGKLTNAETILQSLAKERELQTNKLKKSTLKTHWPARKWKQLQGLMQTLKW
ncbi:capsular polysaccharide biosynthesis protein [Ignatzschineria sp. LJL83]